MPEGEMLTPEQQQFQDSKMELQVELEDVRTELEELHQAFLHKVEEVIALENQLEELERSSADSDFQDRIRHVDEEPVPDPRLDKAPDSRIAQLYQQFVEFRSNHKVTLDSLKFGVYGAVTASMRDGDLDVKSFLTKLGYNTITSAAIGIATEILMWVQKKSYESDKEHK